MQQLAVDELAPLCHAQPQRVVLLDVREPWEIETASLKGITPIPMREIPARAAELPREREIVAVCHHGGRSMQVAMFLEQQGFRLHNLTGGMDAWSREIDPAVPRY